MTLQAKPTVILVGDAGVSSGFAKSLYHYARGLETHYTVHILAMNYNGDYSTAKPWFDDRGHSPWPLHVCFTGGDGFGVGRIKELITKLKPVAIVVQNDPWNFKYYLAEITPDIPVIGIVAVDGKNCRGSELNGLSAAIFWTAYGAEQARLGGYHGISHVIPLGVDTETYKPYSRADAWRRFQLMGIFAKRGVQQPFIVGSVGRNQYRKRLDLTFEYFSDWVHGGIPVEERCDETVVRNAVLWTHVAPTGDQAFDLVQLAAYYKITKRTMIPGIEGVNGVAEDYLNIIYNLFDLALSTTQGEGFGLTTLEMMAAGVEQCVPDWSALGEWAHEAAILIPCTSHAATLNAINVIGGVPDKALTINALEHAYQLWVSRGKTREVHAPSVALAAQSQFCWKTIGVQFAAVVTQAIAQPIEREAVTV